MEIYFIRHGESTANLEKAYQGWTDVKLSATGLEQAKKLGQYFLTNDIHFNKIFSSPLKRALETAQALISCSYDSNIETKTGLKSINVGNWSGITIEEVKENYPHEHWIWKNNVEEFRFPEGESIFDVLQRSKSSLLDILPEFFGKNNRIAIVTHMITIKVLTLWMSGIELNKIWEPQFTVPNTGIVVYTIKKGNNFKEFQFKRKFLEDPVPHLKKED